MMEGNEALKRRGIVNERCTCGHLKTEHMARVHKTTAGEVKVPGHGSCTYLDRTHDPEVILQCACPQFTWKEFVFAHAAEGAN